MFQVSLASNVALKESCKLKLAFVEGKHNCSFDRIGSYLRLENRSYLHLNHVLDEAWENSNLSPKHLEDNGKGAGKLPHLLALSFFPSLPSLCCSQE